MNEKRVTEVTEFDLKDIPRNRTLFKFWMVNNRNGFANHLLIITLKRLNKNSF